MADADDLVRPPARPAGDGKLVDRSARRRDAAVAGHTGDERGARAYLADGDPGVRATALGALVRLHALRATELDRAVTDPAHTVRRRTAELLPSAVSSGLDVPADLVLLLLADIDDTVIDAAAWSAGELWEAAPDGTPRAPAEVVAALSALVTGHDDALVRESAVAALGSIGDRAGLPAILHGCTDKASVRRRAILALAPFDGPDVDAALARAAADRDWQVRQAADDLRD